jgi:hypothetical protein
VFVNKDTKLIDLYRPNELPRSWLPTLAAHAKKLGIMFLATPFDEEAVDQLEAVADNVPRMADAIDAELARPARVTSVTSLRHDPTVEQFRQELIDGMIRVDTVNKLLGLIAEVVGMIRAAT